MIVLEDYFVWDDAEGELYVFVYEQRGGIIKILYIHSHRAIPFCRNHAIEEAFCGG